MRKLLLSFLLLSVTHTVFAQEKIEQDKTDQEKRDWKLNLFTGGTVSLGFFNNTFLIGANPVMGYSLTNWADAGVQFNYTYNAVRNYDFNGVITSRLRETIFGGGPFLRLYPLRFLFAQVQLEHNFIKQKSIPLNGPVDTWKRDVGSVLIGGGYTSGRFGRGGGSFYYLSVLADVSGNAFSPYTDALGRAVPVFRAGLQIPLFQGQGNRYDR